MGASVIIAAAGSASRMQGIDKIFYKIQGKEVLLYSVEAFLNAQSTEKIVIVTSQEKIEKIKALVAPYRGVPIEVVCGGDTRQKSVRNGLERCLKETRCVMIHDAARPMITPDLIDELYHKVAIEDLMAAALGVKVKDTIKEAAEDNSIVRTVPRENLYGIQTPQCFDQSLYQSAFDFAQKNGKDYTDDCQLVEAVGQRVYILPSSYKNIKITTPEDIIIAEAYLKEQKND